MVDWIRANKPAKLEGLWKAVLPEGSTAPPAEFAADLFWLLHQGHILLFTDDTLVVQEVREAQAAEPSGEPKKKKKKKSKKPKPAAEAKEGEEPARDRRPIPPKNRRSRRNARGSTAGIRCPDELPKPTAAIEQSPSPRSSSRNPQPRRLLKPQRFARRTRSRRRTPAAPAAGSSEPETEHEETHPFAD